MAYLGKEFKFEKEEQYEEFVKSLGQVDPVALTFLSFKPNHILQKTGDGYTMVFIIPDRRIEIFFKPGVPFDEELPGGLKVTSVVTVDGDAFTQVQENPKGTVTFKREYSADKLKLTLSTSSTDKVAYRYYVLA